MKIKTHISLKWKTLANLLEIEAQVETKKFGELRTLDSSNKVSQHAWVQGRFVKLAKTWAVFLAS